MARPDEYEQDTTSTADPVQTAAPSEAGARASQRTARSLVDDLQSVLRDTDDVGLRDAIETCLSRARSELDAGALGDEGSLRATADRLGGDARGKVRDAASRVSETARQGYSKARDTMSETVRRSRDTVAERPMTGLGIALVAGLVIGLSMTRPRR